MVTLLSNGQAMTTTDLVAHLPDLAGQPYAIGCVYGSFASRPAFSGEQRPLANTGGVSDPAQLIRQAVQTISKTTLGANCLNI
jgi:hypothetical protein